MSLRLAIIEFLSAVAAGLALVAVSVAVGVL